MKIKALLLVLSLLTMLAIPILSAKAMTVPNPDTFTYLTTGGPQNLDPARAYDTASGEVIFNVYQCLIDFEFDKLDRFVAEVADWWPGYGSPGNAIIPSTPHTWVFIPLEPPVDPEYPVCTLWERKGVVYHLKAWEDEGTPGYLGYCDQVTMEWIYDPILNGVEELEFHVESFAAPAGPLVLTPKFVDATWYFRIRSGMKWQDDAYGTVTPYDVEYTFERDMIHNPSSGPVWMLLEPLTGQVATRGGHWNWPKYGGYNPLLPDQTAQLARELDDSVESNETFVWFNLVKPYAPFQQILCQQWGSILDADWTIAQWDPVSNTHNWNASWHINPGLPGYKCIVPFNKPPQPGPLGGKNTMGCGPYYVQYCDLGTGEFFLHSFDNYYFGWTKSHCDLIHHEVVNEWATRRSRFLADVGNQADMVTVLRGDVNDVQLLAAIDAGKVRYLPDLPSMSADAIFFSWDFDDSLFPHYIGTPTGLVQNATILSDVHMRLALAYCFNASEFIEDYFLGEAVPLHNPNIYGNAYANATKHSTMGYTKNIDLATYHFQMAWGGQDPDDDGVCETPGQVWNYGFSVQIEPTPDADPRTKPCIMIRDVVDNEIEWPEGITHEVKVTPLEWNYAMDQIAERTLGAYVCGWLADFPHPHNWMFPFMHTEGDFSWTNSIQYGRKLLAGNGFLDRTVVDDTADMNWHPQGNYGQNGLPYYNWNNELTSDIDSDYVDGLIMTGIGLTDPGEAEKCYTELADIYYADCASIMTFQPAGRHYERTWVHGWFYNAVYAGLMFMGEMNLWKEDPATVTRSIEITEETIKFTAVPTGGYTLTVHKVIHNNGENPEFVDVYIWIYQWQLGQMWYHVTQIKFSFWLRPCNSVTIDVTIWKECVNIVTVYIQLVEISDWIPTIGTPIQEQPPVPVYDRGGVMHTLPNPHKVGDIGGSTTVYWGFDGLCNYKDASLFQKGYVTAFHELTDFNGDNKCNYKDAGLFRLAYLAP